MQDQDLHPTLAHRVVDRGASEPDQAAELWQGGWFSVPARLRSKTGGRGAALGKSDPTTSATVQARP